MSSQVEVLMRSCAVREPGVPRAYAATFLTFGGCHVGGC